MIEMPYPYHSSRKRMSAHDRAAQFSSFDALKGYDEEVEETARTTDVAFLMDEDERMRINELLNQFRTQKNPDVLLTYFVPDERKPGGKYYTAHCELMQQNTERKELLLSDGKVIPMEHICLLENASGCEA